MIALSEDEWFPVRKKPVEVEARGPVEETESIPTEEGVMLATPGDYIIRGVEGEEYPIKPDIFEQTYERVESGHTTGGEHDEDDD